MFLSIHSNIGLCTQNEYPQQMFCLRNKENNFKLKHSFQKVCRVIKIESALYLSIINNIMPQLIFSVFEIFHISMSCYIVALN